MTETEAYAPRPVARWFTVAATLSVAWMLLGCVMYLYEVTIDPAQLPLDQKAMYAAIPTWMWAAFATAVWVGLAGAVLLLLRRKLAEPLLLISFLMSVIQTSAYFLDPQLRVTVRSAEMLWPIIIMAVNWTIYMFARKTRLRGWLR